MYLAPFVMEVIPVTISFVRAASHILALVNWHTQRCTLNVGHVDMLTVNRACTSFNLVNPSLVQMKYLPTIVVIVKGDRHSGILILMPWHSEKFTETKKEHAVDGQTVKTLLKEIDDLHTFFLANQCNKFVGVL
jgi:hypothetical protein